MDYDPYLYRPAVVVSSGNNNSAWAYLAILLIVLGGIVLILGFGVPITKELKFEGNTPIMPSSSEPQVNINGTDNNTMLENESESEETVNDSDAYKPTDYHLEYELHLLLQGKSLFAVLIPAEIYIKDDKSFNDWVPLSKATVKFSAQIVDDEGEPISERIYIFGTIFLELTSVEMRHNVAYIERVAMFPILRFTFVGNGKINEEKQVNFAKAIVLDPASKNRLAKYDNQPLPALLHLRLWALVAGKQYSVPDKIVKGLVAKVNIEESVGSTVGNPANETENSSAPIDYEPPDPPPSDPIYNPPPIRPPITPIYQYSITTQVFIAIVVSIFILTLLTMMLVMYPKRKRWKLR